MVLVPVSQKNGPQLLLVLTQVGKVGDDQVYPQHLLLREHQTHIDNDYVVSVFDEHHVAADLSQAAKWNDS